MNESQMSKGSEFITQYDLTKLEEMDPSLGTSTPPFDPAS